MKPCESSKNNSAQSSINMNFPIVDKHKSLKTLKDFYEHSKRHNLNTRSKKLSTRVKFMMHKTDKNRWWTTANECKRTSGTLSKECNLSLNIITQKYKKQNKWTKNKEITSRVSKGTYKTTCTKSKLFNKKISS